jgi:hypothetical protein
VIGDADITGAEAIFSAMGSGTGVGTAGFGDSFSRFNRIISNSSSLSRLESSSRPFLALTARAMSQIARAVGIPSTARTTRDIIESIK